MNVQLFLDIQISFPILSKPSLLLRIITPLDIDASNFDLMYSLEENKRRHYINHPFFPQLFFA